MYDNENEIKKKRRTLIIAIAVILVLIFALILFLLTRSGSKTKNPVNTLTNPTCELEVKSGTLGSDDVYTTSVVIGFKNVVQISDKVPVVKHTVGVTDNSKNKDTYTVTKKGKTKVYGYVTDADGNSGTCEIEVELNPTVPTCELEVKSGTLGDNNWYKTDVVVGFKSKDSNNESVKIEKFYIEKKATNLDDDEVVKSDAPDENIETLTIKDDLETELIGHVIDSNGTEGTCDIVVKKDSKSPTCKLKVVTGTPNSEGIYEGEVVVGLDTKEDETSDIAAFGVGVKENYTDETYAVTSEGKTKVYGYVKDNAGNTATCELEITKPTTPEPSKESYPSCTLEVVGSATNGVYLQSATVRFKTKSSTNGASIKAFGLGESPEINGRDDYVINTSGKHTIYGMVQDTNGNTSVCGPVTVDVNASTLLADLGKVGDMVAYDAGLWSNTATVPTTNGMFGGYMAGASKNASVKCRREDTANGSGWKILSISGGNVTIIHAGIAECYYHGANDASTAVSNLNNRARVTYMNQFAQDARMFDYNDYNSVDESFRNVGSHYYMATAKDKTTLYYVSYTGRLSGGSVNANGLRPVIVLKNNVTTTGKDTNGAWVLALGDTKNPDNPNLELPNDLFNQLKSLFDEVSSTIKDRVNSR